MSRRGKVAAVAAGGLVLLTVILGALPLRDRALEEWYLRQLGSPQPEAREEAVRRLGELGSARAVPAMLRLVVRPAGGDRARAGSPAGDGDVPPELTGEDYRRPEESSFFLAGLAPAFPDVRTWQLVRKSLLAMGDRAVAGLNHAFQSDREERAVRKLADCEFAALMRERARRGDATALLRTVADRSLAAELRARGASALARAGRLPDEALPVLLGALREDIPLLRMHAAYLLGTMGDRARVAVPLLESCREDPRHFVQAAAAAALERIQGTAP